MKESKVSKVKRINGDSFVGSHNSLKNEGLYKYERDSYI